MFLRELGQSISVLKGAGSQVTARLARLGVYTIADLILFYPRDYDDRTSFTPLASFAKESRVRAIVEVFAHEWFGYGRMKTLKVLVRDETAEAVLVCFNRSYLENQLPVGARVVVTGKFAYRYGELQSSAFDIEDLEGGKAPVAALLPVYSLTDGLNQGQVRRLTKGALVEYGAKVEEELPSFLREKRGLPPKREALRAIHFPKDPSDLSRARESLVFEELFYFQVAVARRSMRRREVQVDRRPPEGLLKNRLIERLPFELTSGQLEAAAEIAADMASPRPMARLLQGDVGSGKTLVAFLACLDAIESGGQAAIMTPTELLARQHAVTAGKLLDPLGIRLGFLSGNVEDRARRPLLAAIKDGRVDLLLGTQALFSDEVEYRNLRLTVVDEQHRFGVLQRLALSRKGPVPDLLLMTATPIPRTLALTVFGDLEVSAIRTMPPGRKPIVTHLAKAGNEQKVYDFVRALLDAGRQAYFVYPLIGESEKLELKNAEAMAERLAKEIYPKHKVGLIHSRLKEEDKRATMEAFSKGELAVLVATSVVEVGVDVPNAAAMVVEHAERFGLAALHQLRGRVGRGSEQSYCFLVYSDEITEDAKSRLKAMLGTADGFALAEEDLRIRGPGEIAGTAQSGYLRLSIADPIRDALVLEQARAEAFSMLEADPGLLSSANAPVREVLERANPFGDAPVAAH